MTDINLAQKHCDELASMLSALEANAMFVTYERVESAALYLRSLTKINPVSRLPQSPEQIRIERDLLLESQAALLHRIEKLKRWNRNKLEKIRKLQGKK